MDTVLLVKAAVMGVVEGLTEFLPISSTGHLILAGALLGFDDEKAKVFDIAIQTGAILAVIIVYWQKLRDTVVALPTSRQAQRFTLNVLKGALKDAPGFDKDRWPSMSDRTWASGVHKFYGTPYAAD